MSWIALIVAFMALSAVHRAGQRGRDRHSADGAGSPAALDELRGEIRELRDDVMDLGERLDFTERMLADVRRRTVLPGPDS